MKRKSILAVIVVIAILAITGIFVLHLTKGKVKAAEGKLQIVFADKNMYNAVKREVADVAAIKSSNDANMTLIMEEAEVKKVKILNLYQENITNIQGIEKFTDLTALYIYSNKISNISAISSLKNLKILNIGDNPISDISAIKGLTNLTTLQMISNQLTDISVVSNLTNLTNLQIASNKISDISAIRGLTKLTTLQMAANQIGDMSALNNLTNLTTSWIDDQKLTGRAEAGSEYILPAIFKYAKEKYGATSLVTSNCTLSADETKITVGDQATTATVKISGGRLSDSILTLTVDKKQEEHTHTQSTKYTSNGTEHWKVCTECGEIIENTRATHTVARDAAVAATCTKAGKTEGSHCSVCNAVIKAQETVPAKGHTASTTYSNSSTEHWKKCASCGEEIAGTRAKHVDQNSDEKCDTCGYVISNTNNSGNTNTNGNTNNSGNTNTNSNTNSSGSTNTNSNTNNSGSTNTNGNTNTNTNANKKDDMPYTGKEDIAIIVVVVVGLVIFGAIKIKKYKAI